MSTLQPHAKGNVNALESSHHVDPPVCDDSRVLPVQSAGCLGSENDHSPREHLSGHASSLQVVEGKVDERLNASTTSGEACSSTDQRPSAFLSLQQYSDYVVMVPTPRTSSPIPDRSQVSGKPLELEQGSGAVDGDRENKGVVSGQGSRNRGSSQLQKTVGRLKRYFSLAAACGTSSESRQDDVSLASREAGYLPPPAEHELIKAAVKRPAKRRTLSHSDSPDTIADVRRILPLDPTGTRRIYHQSRKHHISSHDDLKLKYRPAAAAPVTGRRSVYGVRVSVDDLALATVVPGIRVRVPPRRQLSHHEHARIDSKRAVGCTTQTGNWLNDTHARSRANVERWLSRNSEADTGTLCCRQQHRGSVQRPHSLRSRASQTSEQSGLERSVSETDVRVCENFRSRDQHRTTPNSLSVAGTPNFAGSTGAEAESHLGPSLVRLVAEIVEGLEQRSRDDSSAVWSGIRAPGTPASKITHQHITNAVTIDDRCTDKMRGQKNNTASPGDSSTQRDKTCSDTRKEAEAIAEIRENVDEGAAREMVPSCSVALLRQRLLRAVEGDSNRRRSVTADGTPQRRKADGKDNSETTTENFKESALISCSIGTIQTYSIGIC